MLAMRRRPVVLQSPEVIARLCGGEGTAGAVPPMEQLLQASSVAAILLRFAHSHARFPL